MCLTLEISAATREKLGIGVCVLGAILSFYGIALIGLAVYMKLHIESQMMLFEGYDTGVLPYFLLSVGIIMALFNAVMGKIALDSGYIDTQERYKNVLFFVVVFCFILFWFVFSGGVLCFSHRSVISETLVNGFSDVMPTYKKDMVIKTGIDQMQQEYKCCGSHGYNDWFKISWINEDSLDLNHPDIISKLKGGLYYSDDVPFSCCDVTSVRPCVHVNINNKTSHLHYSDVSVYKIGCPSKMMVFIDDVLLLPVGWTTLTASFVQLLMLVFLRYLQTSVAEAFLLEDRHGDAVGFCFPACPCFQKGDPMRYVREGKKKDRDEEVGGWGGGGGDTMIDFDDELGDNDKGGHKKDKKDDKKKAKQDKKKKQIDKEKSEKKGKSQDKSKMNKKDKSPKGKPDKKSKSPKDKASPKSKGSPKGKASPKSKGSPKGKASPKSKGSPKGKASPKSKGSPKGKSKKTTRKAKSPKKSPKNSPRMKMGRRR